MQRVITSTKNLLMEIRIQLLTKLRNIEGTVKKKRVALSGAPSWVFKIMNF
jgi:hypothetical protein